MRCPAISICTRRKFLELARALAAQPRLLMLDEVLSGLTPGEIDEAVELIRRIRDQGTTIVLVEHVMRVVTALSDRIVVLDQGRVLARRHRIRRHGARRRRDRLPRRRACLRCATCASRYGAAPRAVERVAGHRRGRARVRRRSQRRRQDHADQRDRRPARCASGTITMDGRDLTRAAAASVLRARASRSCPKAAGCSRG